MTDRIDRALGGELPRDDLSAEERAAVAAFERRVAALRAGLGEAMPHDLDARVMARIRAEGLEPLPAPRHGPGARVAAALWAPRTVRVRVRPAYGLLAAAALAALLLVPGERGTERESGTTERAGAAAASGAVAVGAMAAEPSATRPAATPRIYVQFRFDAEDASDVALAGSFSDWRPAYPMTRSADGVWTVTLPVAPGVHDYAFVVDGSRWVADPYAPAIDDGFGGTNSRLTVLPPAPTL